MEELHDFGGVQRTVRMPTARVLTPAEDREKALRMVESGVGVAEAARECHIKRGTLHAIVCREKQRRQNPQPKRTRRRFSPEQVGALCAWAAERGPPKQTLRRLAERAKEEFGIDASATTVQRILKENNVRRSGARPAEIAPAVVNGAAGLKSKRPVYIVHARRSGSTVKLRYRGALYFVMLKRPPRRPKGAVH